jgi:hypothetical protein
MKKRSPTKLHGPYAELLSASQLIAVAVGASVEFLNGRKHAFFVVRHAGSFKKIAVSHGTKSIKHQIDWVRQNTRRALRELDAIAAGTRSAETVQLAPSEGCQSGGKAASPNPSRQDTSPSSKPSEEQP